MFERGLIAGSFDLYHAGHTAFIREAKKRCAWLMCVTGSDAIIRLRKGHARPIIPLEHRVAVLRENRHIDAVGIMPGDTEEEHRAGIRQIIHIIRPDVVLAGETSIADENYLDIQDEYGFKWIRLSVEVLHTSEIIEKIKGGETQ